MTYGNYNKIQNRAIHTLRVLIRKQDKITLPVQRGDGNVQHTRDQNRAVAMLSNGQRKGRGHHFGLGGMLNLFGFWAHLILTKF